ncbi:MAG TPA: P-II family nitrogen regulator [Pseudonocardiaceae bacterium]|jgi:nitrogen regulatory protein P-II 1
MKLITAVIRPPVFEAIKDALTLFGVRGMTVDQVHQISQDTTHIQIYRGQRFAVDTKPSVKIDLLVPDDELADLTRVISKIMATSGSDGSVWTTQIDLVVRVRTREHGLDAL